MNEYSSGNRPVFNRIRRMARKILPESIRQCLLKVLRATRRPSVGGIRFDDLRRLTPLSSSWGVDRGIAVDRYYIEKFLKLNASDIKGDVLEFGDNFYTQKFGGERVSRSEILDTAEDNPNCTIVADLSTADHIQTASFDCIICTQTLQLIPDLNAALNTLFRILKPGGILLATVPGISQIYRDDQHGWKDYWRFTTYSAEKLLEPFFMQSDISIKTYGNVLIATAFLYGFCAEELTEEEFEFTDIDYQVLISFRVHKNSN